MQKIESALNIFNYFHTTELQIFVTAWTIIWFETFGIGQRIKTWLGWTPMDFVKPFDCRYCTHFWFGSILSLAAFDPVLFALNIVVSQLYSKIMD